MLSKIGGAIGGALKDGVGSISNILTGSGDAADAAEEAAQITAGSQREALEYLKEKERLPSQYRDAALGMTGSELGLMMDEQGNVISDPNFDRVQAAKDDPLYAALLDSGEQSILRSASATGGLRSGNTIASLGNLGRDALLSTLQKQDANKDRLLGLNSYAPQISSQIAGIGQTLGQGKLAGAQAELQGRNQLLGAIIEGGKAAFGGGVGGGI